MGKALHITKESRNNTFIDSMIIGETLIEGQNNSFIRTIFKNFQDQPLWKKVSGVISAIVSLVALILEIIKTL